MKPELIEAATRLTIELLHRKPTIDIEWSDDVIADTFHAAYRGLAKGIELAEKGRPTGGMQTVRTTGR